ncbi:MAG: hypothetical protein LBL26_02895 [Peptococcaceae bacterium]|nr:hypothetical protein [Peptococcaceae bacterium]
MALNYANSHVPDCRLPFLFPVGAPDCEIEVRKHKRRRADRALCCVEPLIDKKYDEIYEIRKKGHALLDESNILQADIF